LSPAKLCEEGAGGGVGEHFEHARDIAHVGRRAEHHGVGLGDLLDQRREVLGGVLDLQQHRGLAGVADAFGDLVGEDGGVAVTGMIDDGDGGHWKSLQIKN
jgi:hypothetical protein